MLCLTYSHDSMMMTKGCRLTPSTSMNERGVKSEPTKVVLQDTLDTTSSSVSLSTFTGTSKSSLPLEQLPPCSTIIPIATSLSIPHSPLNVCSSNGADETGCSSITKMGIENLPHVTSKNDESETDHVSRDTLSILQTFQVSSSISAPNQSSQPDGSTSSSSVMQSLSSLMGSLGCEFSRAQPSSSHQVAVLKENGLSNISTAYFDRNVSSTAPIVSSCCIPIESYIRQLRPMPISSQSPSMSISSPMLTSSGSRAINGSPSRSVTLSPSLLPSIEASQSDVASSLSNLSMMSSSEIDDRRHSNQLFIAAKESCVRKLKRLAETFPLWARQNNSLNWHIDAITQCETWPPLLRYVDILQQLVQTQKSIEYLPNDKNDATPALSISKRLDFIRKELELRQNRLPLPVAEATSKNHGVESEDTQGDPESVPSTASSETSCLLSAPQLAPSSGTPLASASSSSKAEHTFQRTTVLGTSVVLGQVPNRPRAMQNSSSVSAAAITNERVSCITGPSCFEPLPVPSVTQRHQSPHLASESIIRSPPLKPSTSANDCSSPSCLPKSLTVAGLTTQMADAIVLLSRTIKIPVNEVRDMLALSCGGLRQPGKDDLLLEKSASQQLEFFLDTKLVKQSSGPFSPARSRKSSLSSQSSQNNGRDSTGSTSSSLHGVCRSMKGVSFDRSKRNWEASWLDARTGRRVKKCFSEGRWGSSARDMAILARKEAEDSGVISTRQQSSQQSQAQLPSLNTFELLVSPRAINTPITSSSGVIGSEISPPLLSSSPVSIGGQINHNCHHSPMEEESRLNGLNCYAPSFSHQRSRRINNLTAYSSSNSLQKHECEEISQPTLTNLSSRPAIVPFESFEFYGLPTTQSLVLENLNRSNNSSSQLENQSILSREPVSKDILSTITTKAKLDTGGNTVGADGTNVVIEAGNTVHCPAENRLVSLLLSDQTVQALLRQSGILENTSSQLKSKNVANQLLKMLENTRKRGPPEDTGFENADVSTKRSKPVSKSPSTGAR